MRVAVFSSRPYDEKFLSAANATAGHHLNYFESRLSADTAGVATGFDAVCAFVNDALDGDLLRALARGGVRLVALRAAGFNNVDLEAARSCGITVARVPAYSPHAVGEYTLAMILTLNRNTHRAFNRVREGNFALDGLIGFDLNGKTVGVVGTGAIGEIVARLLVAFGCKVLAQDPVQNSRLIEIGVRYATLDQMLPDCDIVTLHCPLTPDTRHVIDARAIGLMKRGVMLINTGRGALVDTRAIIRALKSGAVGSLGLDVYEEESELFFEDRSQAFIDDDIFARLLTFPNVLVTGHQGFFTHEALVAIAETTIANITAFERSGHPVHEVSVDTVVRKPI